MRIEDASRGRPEPGRSLFFLNASGFPSRAAHLPMSVMTCPRLSAALQLSDHDRYDLMRRGVQTACREIGSINMIAYELFAFASRAAQGFTYVVAHSFPVLPRPTSPFPLTTSTSPCPTKTSNTKSSLGLPPWGSLQLHPCLCPSYSNSILPLRDPILLQMFGAVASRNLTVISVFAIMTA